MESPKGSHWKGGKRILRYVSGTKDLGIMYSTLEIFSTNSHNGGSTDDRKSKSGYTFHFGTGLVSWASKKHPIVTLSSAKSEYVAAIGAACQYVWIRTMLKYLSHNQQEPTTISFDNNSTISLSKNHVFHKKNKHIDKRHHFIRELVNNKEICLEFCRSKDQLVDIFKNHWQGIHYSISEVI